MKYPIYTLIYITAAGIAILAAANLYGTLIHNDSQTKQAKQCMVNQENIEKINDVAVDAMAAFQTLKTPTIVPEITFVNQNNEKQSIKDLRGKTILLNLWATWCAPCREEMPDLDQLQKNKGNEKFQVLAISLDRGEANKIEKFYEEINIRYLDIAHDPTLETLNALRKLGLAFGLPATILINENGCAVGALNGPAKWNSDQAHKLINAIRGG